MPAASSVETLHMAVYNALLAHAGVTGIVGAGTNARIYDTVAPASALPYPRIVLQDPTELPWAAVGAKVVPGQDGNRTTLSIHLWTKDADTRGSATVNALFAAVKAALHNVRLTLSTGTIVDGTVVLLQRMLDEDNVSMHAVARYEATGRV